MPKSIFTQEQQKFIVENYPKFGALYCARELNTTRRKVSGWAVNNNIKKNKIHRKYEKRILDFKKFSEFSPSACYLLGFIWGDGHVNKRDTNVSISNKKCDMVNIFSYFLDFGNWYIKCKERKGTISMEMIIGGEEFHKFLSSCDYLIKSGASADKILEKIPNENKKYWWRGYFDADGHFSFEENEFGYAESCSWSITSCFDQDWAFMLNLLESLNIKNFFYKKIDTRNGRRSVIEIKNRFDAFKFLNFIYQDFNGMGFGRKFLEFIKLKKHLEYQEKNKEIYNFYDNGFGS